MLAISIEKFLQIYSGLPICNQVDTFYTEPTSDKDIVDNYMPSKLWRLNNCYTIVNKKGERVRFRMNESQHKVYAASLRHPRVIVLKSRQQGISTLWLVSYFDDGITKKNFDIGLMAQGTDEAEKLLERVKILWETLDENFKSYYGISVIKDNTKEMGFSTKSTLFIRTSFRSTTLHRLHVSELGKIANKYPEKVRETRRGTLQALAQGNTGVIESTAEGDNAFKEMWDTAYNFTGERSLKDFYPVFLSWLDDPDCTISVNQVIDNNTAEYFAKLGAETGITLTQEQKNFWVVQYRELGDGVYQEYPSTPEEAFRATRLGTYYADEFLKRVLQSGREVKGLYDPNLDVQIAVDLGWDDSLVLCVYQVYRDTFRIIDEFADNNKNISHYTDWIKTRHWYNNLIEIQLGHDGAVHDLESGNTREQTFQEELDRATPDNPEPIKVIVRTLARTSRMDGIYEVRRIIGRLWIDSACTYLRKCFLNYRKEWNEKLNKYNEVPLHDEYSNGADAIRYMAVGHSTWVKQDISPREVQEDFDV